MLWRCFNNYRHYERGDYMREIKFRAWDGSKMIEPYSVRNGQAYIIKPCDLSEKVIDHEGSNYYKNWDVDISTDYPLMQYTGLKDKNGVEIYEGDIAKFTPTEGEVWKAEVEFDEGAFFFNMNDYIVASSWWPNISEFGDIEVIGNIHENPDLLAVL